VSSGGSVGLEECVILMVLPPPTDSAFDQGKLTMDVG